MIEIKRFLWGEVKIVFPLKERCTLVIDENFKVQFDTFKEAKVAYDKAVKLSPNVKLI